MAKKNHGRSDMLDEARVDLDPSGVAEIGGVLRPLLADVFALYVKTKNFHWHMTGPHFRDYHVLLDEQAEQVYAMADVIAERARKLGARTVHSIGEIARLKRIEDNDDENLAAEGMLSDLCGDNRSLARFLRETHEVCDRRNDVATASLLEVWIDEAEKRAWFLAQIVGEDASR
jgi:starvation-inducible DNA-binding protein